jgi:hypothetical protein
VGQGTIATVHHKQPSVAMSVISFKGTVIAINAVQEFVSKMNKISLSKEQPTCNFINTDNTVTVAECSNCIQGCSAKILIITSLFQLPTLY